MSSPSTSGSSKAELAAQWLSYSDADLTDEFVQKCFDGIADDLWVAAACVDRLLEDVSLQRTLVENGIRRTEPAVRRTQVFLEDLSSEGDLGGSSTTSSADERRLSALVSYFQDEPADAQLCQLRAILLDRLDRLNTFVEVCKELPLIDGESVTDGLDDEWEDDPWADTADDTRQAQQAMTEPPLPLSSFLTDDLLDISCFLASLGLYSAVRVLMNRHTLYLWPYRLVILQSIPGHVSPADYRGLLPSLDTSTGLERSIESRPWRDQPDWTEQLSVTESLLQAGYSVQKPQKQDNAATAPSPLSTTALTAWYSVRVDSIIGETGMLDNALSLVQHAASQGVPDMAELGEELLLLSRLVYEVPSPEDTDFTSDWTLDRWKGLEPPAVIRAYLAYSKPDDVPAHINKLVMPYLFVLESRAERAGHPDPELASRLLHEYILQAPLEVVAAIFEASKPTLPPAKRLLRSDEDMVRIALACLYGSESLNEWPTMSRIFECLPAWEVPEDEDEADEADTTIISLGAFVTPSTTQPRCTPFDLLLFFKPLPSHSLSRALDVLDVHLESGEILARWSVPASLRWFLQSNGNVNEQRAWANRMARQAGGQDDRLESLEDWEWLLDDMLKLSGSGESGLKGAFCLLTGEEIQRIFLSGLLSSGKFRIAQSMLRFGKSKLQLPATSVEEVCLSCSQEFYDNAQSGNYHFGDMKLAYDCLDVPTPSRRVIQEKDFIEATSRLCSFNLMSSPGNPITPLEIRLTKDRLSLVSRVLSSNAEAYKYAEVIRELVRKLGFDGDTVAEVKTLAMLTDTALTAEDFQRAYENCEKMIGIVLDLRASRSTQDADVQQASEVCWVSCFQLGRYPEFEDLSKRGSLLGRAMELCPPERLVDILTSWRRLDQEDLDARRERQATRRSGRPLTNGSSRHTDRAAFTTSSLASRLQQLNVPNSPLVGVEAAALANKAFHSVAANFPFSVGSRGRTLFSEDNERSRSGSRSRLDGAEVSAQATRVLQKGLGWLLGDE